MTILRFSGEVEAPPAHCAMSCSADTETLTWALDLLEEDYAEILSGGQLLITGLFEQLLAPTIDSLRFLALSVPEGVGLTVEVLVGTRPTLAGASGVFPLVAGGTLEFELQTYGAGSLTTRFTVTTTLVLGDTAALAAQRINAAAALAGVPTYPVATVVAGQLVLTGDKPGALETIEVTQEFAGAGFPDPSVVLGTGSPVTLDRFYVASFGLSPVLSSQNVWVRGTGSTAIRYVAAGN